MHIYVLKKLYVLGEVTYVARYRFGVLFIQRFLLMVVHLFTDSAMPCIVGLFHH